MDPLARGASAETPQPPALGEGDDQHGGVRGQGAGAEGGSSEAREVRDPQSVKLLTAQCPLSPHTTQALGTADPPERAWDTKCEKTGLVGPPPIALSHPQALRPPQPDHRLSETPGPLATSAASSTARPAGALR